MGKTLFISDLHLAPHRKEILNNFNYFIEQIILTKTDIDGLYILGDLFDFWIGDDENAPFHQHIATQLSKLKKRNIPCFFIRGNRDLLLGERYAQQAGFTILSDPTLINLYQIPTLLTHGDTLCTQDIAYQNYRKVVNHPILKFIFLALPLFLRLRIVKKIKTNSSHQKERKEFTTMDVTDDAVKQIMQKHLALRLIHGHTHKGKFYPLQLELHTKEEEEIPLCLEERICLHDWGVEGHYLEISEQTARFVTFTTT